MLRTIRKDAYRFNGAMVLTASSSSDATPWRSKITKTAGTPTVQVAAGGALALALDNANEVQNLCAYFGDLLSYPYANLVSVEALFKLDAAPAAVVSAFVGVGGARADALNSIATMAGFRITSGGNLLAETYDGTTRTSVDTGIALGSTYKWARIDFADGNYTQGPPSISTGGLANVLFHLDNAAGYRRRVAEASRFNLSGVSALNCQPIFQIQKTANAATGTLSIKELVIEYKLAG